MNPLLENFTTPYQTPPFHLISENHYKEAFEKAIEWAKNEVEQLVQNSEKPSFKNTIEALEYSGLKLSVIAEIFFNLNSAETTDTLQELAQELSPMLSEYSNDILLHKELFNRIKTVYNQIDRSVLSAEQIMLLDKTYKSFSRNGAALKDAQKEELRAIDQELSKLSLQFGQNLLSETNAYKLWIENEEDLAGLPEFVREAAAEAAKEEGREGAWLFTLKADSFTSFMTYSSVRNLREELYKAYASRAFKGNEFDNTSIIKQLVSLKTQRAQLLGYTTHADYVLEERMAKTPVRFMIL